MELSEKVLNVPYQACKRDADDSDDGAFHHRSSFAFIIMLFSFFKTLVGKQITVELKRLEIEALSRRSVPEHQLNRFQDEEKYPP